MKLGYYLAVSSCLCAGALISGCSSGDQNSTTESSSTSTSSTTTSSTGNSATGTSTGNSATSSTTTSGKALKLAFVTNNASDFWTIARRGVEKADKEDNNVTVEFKIPGDGTAAGQKQIIDDLLAKGIQGFAISPVDPANQTAMINDASKKATVITQDSDAPKSARACYIGTDNQAAGKQAGELIKKVLPNGGNIMLFVGKLDAQNAKDRMQGIKDAIAGTKIKIVDTRTDNTDHTRAKSNVSDALVKYPDLACLVGLWSYNGPAIYNAVKEANKVGKIKIVCFDEEDETLAGVQAGAIAGTVVQQPFEFGYQSVKLLTKLGNGDKSSVPADKRIIVPTKVIDKSSVAAFIAKMKELRGK